MIKAPTACAAGERTYTCKVCGHSYTEAIPATGSTSKPADTASTTEPAQVPTAQVGSTATVSTGAAKARVKVTKTASAGKTAEVAYVAPEGNVKAAVIPDTVVVGGTECAVTAVAASAFKGKAMFRHTRATHTWCLSDDAALQEPPWQLAPSLTTHAYGRDIALARICGCDRNAVVKAF